MKKPIAPGILDQDILLSEMKCREDFKALKEQVQLTYESLKPINLIKNAFKNATELPEMKQGLGKVAIGVASGYLAKNLIFHSSNNFFKRITGIALQTIVTNITAKNFDEISQSGVGIFNVLKSLIVPKRKEYPEKEI